MKMLKIGKIQENNRGESAFNKSQTFYRSSHQKCSIKIGVLKNFAKFTHVPESLFE